MTRSIDLADFHGHSIAVHKLRNLIAFAVFYGRRESSVACICYGDNSLLHRKVIGISFLVPYKFPDLICISSGLPVDDRRKDDVAFRIIIHCLFPDACGSVVQFEDKLLVLQLPVLQGLFGLQGYRSACFVPVGEKRCAAVIDGSGCQRAVFIINDCDYNSLLGCIVGIAGPGLCHLSDGICVSPGLGVDNGIEGDLSVPVVLLCLPELVALVEFEAELSVFQRPAGLAGQFLLCFENDRSLCLVGVGKYRFAASRPDRAGIAAPFGIGVARDLFFGHGIGDLCRKTFGCPALSMSEPEPGHTVSEDHISICAADAGIAQSHCEGKFSVFVDTALTDDGLFDCQVSGLPGVGKFCGYGPGFTDAAGIAAALSYKAFDRLFCYGISDLCRQSLRCSGLAVLQLCCGHTVRKGHITVGSVHCPVIQLNGEGEGLVPVSRPVGYDFLADLEISGLSGVGEGRCGNGLADRTGLSSKCRHEQVVSSFFYLVADALRKAFRHAGFAV